MTKLQVKLGARIRELRDLAGLSREEYASKIDLSERRVASIELGKGWPRPGVLERIADVFSLEVCDLFDFSTSRTLPRRKL